jgi:hypothetical protein
MPCCVAGWYDSLAVRPTNEPMQAAHLDGGVLAVATGRLADAEEFFGVVRRFDVREELPQQHKSVYIAVHGTEHSLELGHRILCLVLHTSSARVTSSVAKLSAFFHAAHALPGPVVNKMNFRSTTPSEATEDISARPPRVSAPCQHGDAWGGMAMKGGYRWCQEHTTATRVCDIPYCARGDSSRSRLFW